MKVFKALVSTVCHQCSHGTHTQPVLYTGRGHSAPFAVPVLSGGGKAPPNPVNPAPGRALPKQMFECEWRDHSACVLRISCAGSNTRPTIPLRDVDGRFPSD